MPKLLFALVLFVLFLSFELYLALSQFTTYVAIEHMYQDRFRESRDLFIVSAMFMYLLVIVLIAYKHTVVHAQFYAYKMVILPGIIIVCHIIVAVLYPQAHFDLTKHIIKALFYNASDRNVVYVAPAIVFLMMAPFLAGIVAKHYRCARIDRNLTG